MVSWISFTESQKYLELLGRHVEVLLCLPDIGRTGLVGAVRIDFDIAIRALDSVPAPDPGSCWYVLVHDDARLACSRKVSF